MSEIRMMPDAARPAAELIVFHRGRVDAVYSGERRVFEKIGWTEETDGQKRAEQPTLRARFFVRVLHESRVEVQTVTFVRDPVSQQENCNHTSDK
jgi:hypothetical protein